MTRITGRVVAAALLVLVAMGLSACGDGYDKIGGPCTNKKPMSENRAGKTLVCTGHTWVAAPDPEPAATPSADEGSPFTDPSGRPTNPFLDLKNPYSP